MKSLLLQEARKNQCNAEAREKARQRIESAVYFERTLYTIEEFMRLVWMEAENILGSDLYNQLTPKNEPRTLKNLVKRIRNQYPGGSPHENLKALDHQLSEIPEVEDYKSGTNTSMNTKWFQGCLAMNGTFDARLVRELWVRDLLRQEREQSPDGIYYIEDGSHRALVYALNLEFKQTEYIPIKVRWCQSWQHILPWAQAPEMRRVRED